MCMRVRVRGYMLSLLHEHSSSTSSADEPKVLDSGNFIALFSVSMF